MRTGRCGAKNAATPFLAMHAYSISKIARACDLSRSTLLYYDCLGLLKASGRTA